MMQQVNQRFDKVDLGISSVQLTLNQVKDMVVNIAEGQADLGIHLRQAAADANRDLKEMKAAYSAAGETMSKSFAPLDGLNSSISTADMSTMIQTAVTAATSNLASSPGLSDDLKQFVSKAVADCGAASNVSGDSDETKKHLLTMAATLLEIKDDVKRVSSEIAEVRKDLKEVNAALGSQTEILRAIITGNHNALSLILVIPREVKSRKFGISSNFFKKKFVVSFVCPVTKRQAKSGPKGEGYRLELPKDWVKKAAPVLAITLKIVQVALLAYGIPLPLPPLPCGMSSNEFVTELYDVIKEEVTMKVTGIDDSAMEDYLDSYESSVEATALCEDSERLSKKKEGKLALAIQQCDMKVSYDAIRALLVTLEKGRVDADWEPEMTGLKKVVSKKDGTIAWVSEEGMELFHELGAGALA